MNPFPDPYSQTPMNPFPDSHDNFGLRLYIT